jgi:hypothetical protein
MNKVNFRMALGVALLVIGLLMPLGTVLVAQTDWSSATKSLVSGGLVFGFEVMALIAAGVMGKENFQRVMAPVRNMLGRWLSHFKLARGIGPVRHAVGVTLFFTSFLPAYVMSYVPSLLPDAAAHRLWLNLLGDAVFLASLVLLGGDFWDKLRGLFKRQVNLQDAANLPPKSL